MVMLLWRGMVIAGSGTTVGAGGVGGIPCAVNVCVAVTVARMMIVKLTPRSTVALPVSVCAGLGGGVAGIGGQKPLYTGESKVRLPKLSCRGKMIEGGQSELLLAVATESAMILPCLTVRTIGRMGHSGVTGAPGCDVKREGGGGVCHVTVLWRKATFVSVLKMITWSSLYIFFQFLF